MSEESPPTIYSEDDIKRYAKLYNQCCLDIINEHIKNTGCKIIAVEKGEECPKKN